MKQALASILAAAVLVLGLGACGTKPPRQAEAPEPEATSGVDMVPQETAPTPAGEGKPDEMKAEKEAMHEKCCGECKAGLAKDRSGAKPETIPCVDFTATLSPWCLEHFRSVNTMANQCK